MQIETAPDIQFQSSLTQDLQVEANLRLRGTASNPAFLGPHQHHAGPGGLLRNAVHDQPGLGRRFTTRSRSSPILDIDLETKARGIDVTLTVSGPLNKLNLTPRSDPPLQFNEIVALLATGRTPDLGPVAAGAAEPPRRNRGSRWAPRRCSGQAIANPVAGRLQRFFGVSKLRIDPTLPGVENNPQARLTLEQQVTPDITFTYITNVTSSNPQVVRVEWSVSKQWSVVALREENGVYSLTSSTRSDSERTVCSALREQATYNSPMRPLIPLAASAAFLAWAVRGRSSSVFGRSYWRGPRRHRVDRADL